MGNVWLYINPRLSIFYFFCNVEFEGAHLEILPQYKSQPFIYLKEKKKKRRCLSCSRLHPKFQIKGSDGVDRSRNKLTRISSINPKIEFVGQEVKNSRKYQTLG